MLVKFALRIYPSIVEITLTKEVEKEFLLIKSIPAYQVPITKLIPLALLQNNLVLWSGSLILIFKELSLFATLSLSNRTMESFARSFCQRNHC